MFPSINLLTYFISYLPNHPLLPRLSSNRNISAIFQHSSQSRINFKVQFVSFSHRPLLPQHNQHCLKQNPNIQQKRPFRDILGIQLYNLFKVRNFTSTAHLPHSCQTRLDCQSCPVMQLVFFPLIHCRRTCSDEAHITF